MLPIVISVIVFTLQITALPDNSCSSLYGKNGTCISFCDCSHAFNITEEQQTFVRNSKCEDVKRSLVCCGLHSQVSTTTTTTTTPTTTTTIITTTIITIVTTATPTTNSPPPPPPPLASPKRNSSEGLKFIPDRQHCGFQMTDRISRGTDTNMEEFPWLAILRYKRPETADSTFGCLGSLISPRYVLTTANCLTGPIVQRHGSLVKVTLGDWNTSDIMDCSSNGRFVRCATLPSTNVYVEKVILHQDHDPSDINSYNDIGLVKLQRDVKYTRYIQPICLPKYNEHSEVGHKMWVSGWGKIKKGELSDVKLKLAVLVIDKEKCAEKYAYDGVTLAESQICAGVKSSRDICRGNTGGPLMTTAANNSLQWYIEGIVSFGPSTCGLISWPIIYTKVSSFLDWIYENVDA